MCGIAGVHTSRPVEEAREAVGRMVKSLRHRGPDGNGEACIPLLGGSRHLVMGHARLSILDLSELAAQPMRDPETGSWLLYNGEIYNFRELRSELQGKGYAFQSNGDTEVLLKALVAWGEESLSRLRGMYAFAFWDGHRKKLMLGRDPFGIKPLLLARNADTILFASELRSLRDAGMVRLTLNGPAIESYLVYGAVIEPCTIATEALAIPPGTVVIVDGEGHIAPPKRICTVHDLVQGGRDRVFPGRFKTAVREIHNELVRSVEAHLVSDVPIGIFLSGGVDSSLIASLSDKAQVAQEVNFLTVGFPEKSFSEVRYARQVAGRLSGTHHVIDMTGDDMRQMLPKGLSAVDQPTVDGMNTFVISRVAAGLGIKVLLSGLGGDEIFGGYTTFRKVPFLCHHHRWLSLLAGLQPALSRRNYGQWHKLVLSRRIGLIQDAYFLHRAARWQGATSYLSLPAVPPDDPSIPPETLEQVTGGYEVEDFYQVACLEMMFYMRNQLLRDADIFGSANSVEIRVPYLHWDLVKKAWSMPASFHISPLRGRKLILKNILGAAHPGAPVGRRKMGFVLPWTPWLQGPLFQMVADCLHSRKPYESLGLDCREGKRALQSFMSNDPLVSWVQIWSLFVLLQWQQDNQLAARG
jgi:asparagine synthase (glutamine-hydrolysing)